MGNLASAVDELLAADVGAQPDSLNAAELVEIRRQITRLETAYLDRVAAVDAHGIGDPEHNGSTAGWLREVCRLAPGVAGRQVHLARGLAGLPVTRGALVDATIAVEHAQQIDALRRDLDLAVVQGAELELVAAAEDVGPVPVPPLGRLGAARLRPARGDPG